MDKLPDGVKENKVGFGYTCKNCIAFYWSRSYAMKHSCEQYYKNLNKRTHVKNLESPTNGPLKQVKNYKKR